MFESEYLIPYILGGNANFNIINRNSKKQLEYLIIASKEGKLWYVYIVKNKIRVYAGFLTVKKGIITYSRGVKGNYELESEEIKALNWVIINKHRLGEVIDVIPFGNCSVCGIKLKDEESVSRGIGSTCYKKIKDKLKM